MTHLKFFMKMCQKQTEKGRLLMFEHPYKARPWAIDAVNQVLRFPGVVTVDFDWCQYGTKSHNHAGEGLVRKRTRIMTNSKRLARILTNAQCT